MYALMDGPAGYVLLVLCIAVAVLAGWLTWRAARAQRRKVMAARQAVEDARKLADAQSAVAQLVQSSRELVQFCQDSLAALAAQNIQWQPATAFTAEGRLALESLLGDAQTSPLAPRDALQQSYAALQNTAGEVRQFVARRTELEAATGAVVKHLEARIAEVRAVPFCHDLPLLPGQEALPVVHERQLYGEADPDLALTEAAAHLNAALAALCQGNHSECERLNRLARCTAEDALTKLDSHVSARLELETNLLPAFERLQRLEAQLQTMSGAYEEYRTAFPNCDDAPTRMYENVRNAVAHTSGSLFGLQDGYVHQRFVFARETLRRLIERLQRMESTLPDLPTILSRLKAAHDRLADAQSRLAAHRQDLSLNLERSRFALSDKEQSEALALITQSQTMQLSQDWLAAEKAVSDLSQQITVCDGHVLRRGAAYVNARASAGEASTALQKARAIAEDDAAGEQTIDWFSQAESKSSVIDATLRQNGSDWTSVTAHAVHVQQLCSQISMQAGKDREEFDQASEVFKKAKKKMKKLEEIKDGLKSKKMKRACELMEDARKAMKKRRWTEALAIATSAQTSFQAALNARKAKD